MVEIGAKLLYTLDISKIQEKGGALGGTRVMILCLELGFVWLVYFGFGLATSLEIPIWATAMLVIAVDRTVTFISTFGKERRDRLRE